MPVAMVTGGSNGLGLAIAKAFLQEGYEVHSLDLSPSQEESNCVFHQVDIRKPREIEKAVNSIKVLPDVLVNCAGITRDRVCWKMSLEEWQAVLDVNLTGAFNVVRHLSPLMKKRGSGVVINISSINGHRGKFGQSNYVAAKAGLEGLTKNWAIELGAFGIRVNAVAPGMVETELTKDLPAEVLERAQKERLLTYAPKPEDIAASVLFLSSEQAKCITGQILNVDSGQLVG